jgi:hypothetical protein
MAKKVMATKAKQTGKRNVARKPSKRHVSSDASKPRLSRAAAESNRSEAGHPHVENRGVEQERPLDRGALMEHFRGERNRGERTGDAGSLDEETLDRDAPYNHTYGR